MTTPLTPSETAEYTDTLEAPADGEPLVASSVNVPLQTLLNNDAALKSALDLEYVHYGYGGDGVLAIDDASQVYTMQRDMDVEEIQFNVNNAKIRTNGYTLRSRRCFLAAGVTSATITGEASLSDQTQQFTAAGVYTLVVPAGVTSLPIRAAGGNGGGGATYSGLGATSKSRGGRGGGGAAHYFTLPVTAGDTITFEVGAGGKGGKSVPVGAESSVAVHGPQGGFGGEATRIFKNGTLVCGVAGGGGGGAGSGVVVPGTVPSTANGDPTYGYAGGNGGSGRVSTVTSGSTHKGTQGGTPANASQAAGADGGEDAASDLSSGGARGAGNGVGGTNGTTVNSAFPTDGYGRGGVQVDFRNAQGGSGGENGATAFASKAGGGGGAGLRYPALNYYAAAGGGGGGVGYHTGAIATVTSGSRGTQVNYGTASQPDGKDGDPGYVYVYGLPDVGDLFPGSVGAGQPGGTSANPVPTFSSTTRYHGGRGGSGGGEGTTSPGASGGRARGSAVGIQIRGPATAVSNYAGLGGLAGMGATPGFGGAGSNVCHVAIRDTVMTETNAVLTIEARGRDGDAAAASTTDGGGGGGGGGAVKFLFRTITAVGAIGSMNVRVRSRGGDGGAGGSGTGSSAMGGAGGDGGDPGPVHVHCTGPDVRMNAYDSTTIVTEVARFNSQLREPIVAAVLNTAPTPGAAGLGVTPWTGGAGGSGGILGVTLTPN